jgi:hypothetical protein
VTKTLDPTPPKISSTDTIDEIVAVSKRQGSFPIRRTFLQQMEEDRLVAGPLAALVRAGDHRGLELYLLLLTKASSDPWDAALPATVWARALGLPLPDTKTARSTISKTWMRLERHGLVTRKRSRRLADVTLLREDGSGESYTSPGEVGDRYIRVPLALWTAGPSQSNRWYQTLTLPELAVLLIGRSMSDGFRLPFEMGPDWYGISADTLTRGIAGLKKHGLLDADKTFKKAPLSPVGYTAEHRYTLQKPFGPAGRKSGNRGPRK